MDKQLATYHLGGNPEGAARWLGISAEVYRQWPERLSLVMTDRVYAAIIRKETAAALGMNARQFFADMRGETVIEAMLMRVSIAAVMANMMERVPPEYERRQPPPPNSEEEDQPRKRRPKLTATPSGKRNGTHETVW